MSSFVTVLKWLAVLVAVIAAGLLLGWLGTSGSRNPVSLPAPPPAPPTTAAAQVGTKAISTAANTRTPVAVSNRLTPIVAAASTNQMSDWEDKLDQILTADVPDEKKAKQMEQMFLKLPEDGQIEVAQHLSNLVEDKDYASLSQFLTNSILPESVLDVLLADALNRPNSLKMPILLAVARDSQNPKSGEAKDVLELFLEEDYGNDWATWESKMKQWLKDNPD